MRGWVKGRVFFSIYVFYGGWCSCEGSDFEFLEFGLLRFTDCCGMKHGDFLQPTNKSRNGKQYGRDIYDESLIWIGLDGCRSGYPLSNEYSVYRDFLFRVYFLPCCVKVRTCIDDFAVVCTAFLGFSRFPVERRDEIWNV